MKVPISKQDSEINRKLCDAADSAFQSLHRNTIVPRRISWGWNRYHRGDAFIWLARFEVLVRPFNGDVNFVAGILGFRIIITVYFQRKIRPEKLAE